MGAVVELKTRRVASELDRQIGERIRKRRHDIGMSQSTLAMAIGVTFQQVQKYERGANRISAVTLVEIAKALDLDVVDLLQTAGKKKKRGSTEEIAQAAGKLNERGRARLLDLIEELAKNKDLVSR